MAIDFTVTKSGTCEFEEYLLIIIAFRNPNKTRRLNSMLPLSRDDSSHKHTNQMKRLVIEHYDELHEYAARQIALEKSGQTLDATALLNEAVVKLLEPDKRSDVNDAGHFMSKAKLVMKHILIDRARHKDTHRAGGQFQRRSFDPDLRDAKQESEGHLIFQEELRILAKEDPVAAKLVELRCSGYSIADAARQLNLSRSSAYDLWNFGRAWLMKSLVDSNSGQL